MSSNVRAVVERWKAQGEGLSPPLSVERRRELIAPLHSSVVEDVEYLYSLCNGMASGNADSNLFSLWPLETCCANATSWPPGRFPFADGFIAAHTYYLEPGSEHSYRVYATYGTGDSTLLAESLEEVFGLLLRAPEKLLLPV